MMFGAMFKTRSTRQAGAIFTGIGRPLLGSTRRSCVVAVLLSLLLVTGCAKYNTFYNAKRAFDKAEQVREDKIRLGEDVTKPTGNQITEYQNAIRKCQRVLEEYPGHSLTDDALFMMGKAYHRVESYRMSVSKLNLLFQNYPANPFLEEAYFLQAVNYLFIGDGGRSNDYLDLLQASFPESSYQAEALRVSGENAYALEQWENAAVSFSEFLATHPDDERAPRVGLMHARVLWQLHDYAGVADRLEAVLVSESIDKENLFDTRLLLARALARLGRHEEAEDLLNTIEPEGEIYAKQGMVALAKGENAYHAGRPEDALSILSSMPDAWRRGDVLPLGGELQGEIQLAKWELEEASIQFRAAANGQRVCENPDRVRLLNVQLQRYLDMENRLDGARDEQRPAYRLVQANALAFGLERPRLALDIYLEVAATADVDSMSAVRGLFGAAAIFREQLAMPDSAAALEQVLMTDFPDTPQAYVLREGDEADLYSYLMDKERELVLLAALTETEEEVDAADGEIHTAPGLDQAGDITTTTLGRQSRWRLRKLERNRGLGRG